MKIDYKKLLIAIIIPVFLGSLVGFITAPSNDYYNLVRPPFAPPAAVFPIVWTILYALMGVSSYLVYESKSECRDSALFIYGISLVINLFWSVLFFLLNLRLLAFLWLLLLIVFVALMIKQFYCSSKIAAYLQIPYFIWLIFAAILNFSIVILN